jgi:hypothetical protein
VVDRIKKMKEYGKWKDRWLDHPVGESVKK